MKVDRRDIFKFAGGTAFGIVLTPIPWKLLDDTAIWSQNWSWIPKPLKGEIKTKFSTCTLCPAGCGIRARCVGEQPVSLSGVAGHPASGGSLCPQGLGGHHLAYHPARLRQALRRGEPVATGEAAKVLAATLSSMKQAGSRDFIAIMDGQPGRAVSEAYRQWIGQFPSGVYLQPANRESATLEALASLTGSTAPLGIDLENTRTLLSFGAPVMDGWTAPGRAAECRRHLKLIQAESRQSRTALLADRWLPLNPGTEATLALGLANVIVQQKLYAASVPRAAADFAKYVETVSRFTPEFVSGVTGVQPRVIVEVATMLATGGPAVVVGGGSSAAGPLSHDTETAIAALNLLLGSTAIVPRRERVGTVQTIASLPDRSVGVLLIDASSTEITLPIPLMRRKLAANPLVIAFSPFANGYAKYSEFVVPVPAHFETVQDIPTPFDAPTAVFAISAPLYPAPEGVVEPAAFLAKVSESAGLQPPADVPALQKARAEAIRKSGQGTLFSYKSGQRKPVKEAGAEEEFWKALNEGAMWVDAKSPAKPFARFNLATPFSAGAKQTSPDFPLALVPFGDCSGTARSSPLMTKLYQESDLRETTNTIRVNPQSAAGLKDRTPAILETSTGSVQGRLIIDPAVMPGVVEVAVSPAEPGVLDICTIESDGTWRNTAARIRRA